MKKILILLLLSPVILFSQGIMGDKTEFSRQDTLRGSITKERSWWDLNRYHLDISVKPEEKFISGYNKISYTVLKSHDLMQIDLQAPLILTKATQDNSELEIIHDGNAHFIKLEKKQNVGSKEELVVYYEGNPRVAVRAPWDGGISWEKDKNGNHFIASSCQGLGASVWWPNKDHMYDEPESMLMSVNVPKGLTNVSNGRLVKVDEMSDSTTFHWEVVNPINNYGVNINIGDYVNFSEVYKGEKGNLDMDYYVLSYNLEKAKVHFVDAIKTMQAFEYWFGPYPFYEDSFKLVETPYLGMEHQSSVTYGNKYRKGYLGRDLSGTGWGLKFDYIIIHETGHEWFANNITYKDIADMWVHEGFTTYSENLFVDYHFGKKASSEYVIGTRRGIGNKKPIIGPYNVNKGGSGDMYSKGANLLHTLRQVAGNDKVWRNILRGLNKEFYHQTVTTQQVESYISTQAGLNLGKVFDQYLRDVRIPIFEYYFQGEELQYRWTNAVKDFDMPVDVLLDGKAVRLQTKTAWQTLEVGTVQEVVVDPDYYVGVLKSRE